MLVRTNAQGLLVRDACAEAGVPAVLTGSTSVFTTPVAAEWLTLLEAVEQPQRSMRLRAAALTRFVGHTVADLCGPDAERLVDQLGADLRAWHQVLAERGVAALQEAVFARYAPAERLLRSPDGERDLTDVRHVGQVLHSAALERHLGPTALTEWLRHRIGEAARDTSAERSRRLESDADAVQIVTVHRSKGLEFPVVYLPFAWDRWVDDRPETLLYHDTPAGAGGQRRLLDVGGSTGPDRTRRTALHQAEEAGEDLRLLYVALTRACSQVVAWWVPGTTTAAASLHRVLFGHAGPGAEPEPTAKVPGDANALAFLRERLAPAGASVETLHDRDPADRTPVPPDAGLAVATFTRTLDTAWRRTSYTALTAAAHAAHHPHPAVDAEPEPAATAPGVLTEPEDEGIVDEPDPAPLPGAGPTGDATAGAAGPASFPSPMADLPSGTGFGTLVHAVLEHLDTRTAARATPRCGPRSSRTSPRSCATSRPTSIPTSSPTRSSRSCGPRSGRSRPGWRWPTSRRATGCRSWTSSCRCAAGTPRRGGSPWPGWPPPSAGTSGPATRCTATPTSSTPPISPDSRCAAT
nr:3'-5' exonuclease [Pseudonocardia sp. AL041005-10]